MIKVLTGEEIIKEYLRTHTVKEHNSQNSERYVKVSELQKFIDIERNNGNMSPAVGYSRKSFSPALCLSKILELIK